MTRARALAAAQTVPIRGDVERNIAQHLRLVRAAAKERAEVLVFPELSLTGYELDLAGELAFSPRDARLAPLADEAAASSMTLVVGAPVMIESRLYIGALVIGADRDAAVYTKRHLGAFPSSASPDGVVPPAEATVFDPGNHDPLVRLGTEIAAVAVCADVHQASHPRAAADRGARIYLASMFVIPSDLETDITYLETYAVRHSMTVVFANYGGPSGGLPAGGRSAIWSDSGELLAQLGETGAGVVAAVESPAGWRCKTVTLDGP
jgi:predicted amidohydrolase